MPTDQLQTLPHPAAVPQPPADRLPEILRDEDLSFLRDALVSDRPSSAPEGWAVYATEKFLGRAALAVFALSALASLAANALIRSHAIPAMLSLDGIVFALPAAVLALWFAWTGEEDRETARRRAWPGRLATGAILYAAIQAVAALSRYAWISIFVWG